MYVCVLGQGRTVIPTGLSINYKSNQIEKEYIMANEVVNIGTMIM